MKGIFFSLLLVSFFSIEANAQFNRFVIVFRDKTGSPYTIDQPSAYLSARSLQRRNKQHIAIDSTDLPINPAYLDSIRNVPNVVILNASKWMNQVLIRTSDSTALEKINLFPFVQHADFIAPNSISTRSRLSYEKFNTRIQSGVSSSDCIASSATDPGLNANYYNYGNTYAQIHLHQGEYLHNLGFHGEGMQVALLDAGFYSYLNNPAFDSVLLQQQVLGTYDYVNLKEGVDDESVHGAYCLGLMAANEPGNLIGTAPAAAYWLLITEDVNSEYPVEEQNWVAAAEFADSAGVDLISTSLGYSYFDDPAFDHPYADRNGHTALVSRAANLAVSKGMIVTASAGNSGEALDNRKYILCPADADSALAVGAVDVNGNIASFSSWGPNSSGAVKPNVVSQGQDVIIADPNGNAVSGNGTSFSNPNLAGLITCLWQAFPEFNNHDIIDAVQKSADRYTKPDVRLGYGIPNFEKAYQILKDKRTQIGLLTDKNWIEAFPVPFTSDFTVLVLAQASGNASIQLSDAIGRIIETQSLVVANGNAYTIRFNSSAKLSRGIYLVKYTDSNRKKTLRVIRL